METLEPPLDMPLLLFSLSSQTWVDSMVFRYYI